MSIKEILKKPNGANFRIADLHIHTPADKSKNYEMVGEKKQLNDEDWCRHNQKESHYWIMHVLQYKCHLYLG